MNGKLDIKALFRNKDSLKSAKELKYQKPAGYSDASFKPLAEIDGKEVIGIDFQMVRNDEEKSLAYLVYVFPDDENNIYYSAVMTKWIIQSFDVMLKREDFPCLITLSKQKTKSGFMGWVLE